MDKTPKNKRITALNVFFQTFTTMNVASHGKAVTRPTNGYNTHTNTYIFYAISMCFSPKWDNLYLYLWRLQH